MAQPDLLAFLSSTVEASKFKGGFLAVLAASFLILRYSRARKLTQLIRDLNRVGGVEGGEISPEHEFDVIVAGGGTAGCVLASRISEDRSIKVLLLESGGSGLTNILSRTPARFGEIIGTENCWNYHTEPQTALTGRASKYWPQGRMLGGSSSMSAMMVHYGCPEDYNQWARDNSDPGAEIWSYALFSKYFRRFEKYAVSERFPLVDRISHGSSGPVEIGYFGYYSKITSKFIKSCVRLGIPYVPDTNTIGGTLGVTKIMTYINSKGRRVSAESAYLTPQVLSRPNLKVAVHAHVTRILFEKDGDLTRAVGVEFATARHEPRFVARAKKEVIISAGAINSPQVLMLSGIGPAQHLASHSITVVKDMPGMGSHLQDHLVVNVTYRDKTKTSLSFASTTIWDKIRLTLYSTQWSLFGTGPMTSNVGEAAAFVRSTDSSLFSNGETPMVLEDSASGPGAPDLEILVTPMPYKEHGLGKLPSGHMWSLHTTLLRPTSHGTITLKSTDPFEQPAIDPRYLTTEHDVNVMVRGLKLASRIAHTKPLGNTIDEKDHDPLLDHNLHLLNDSELAELVRNRTETLYHPCSTARMAPLSEGGVVDPYLRVHGIPNLRVVDASVLPEIVGGHTCGVVLAVAEQAADLVKAAVGSS